MTINNNACIYNISHINRTKFCSYLNTTKQNSKHFTNPAKATSKMKIKNQNEKNKNNLQDMRYDNPTTQMTRNTIRFLASSARSRIVTCCFCELIFRGPNPQNPRKIRSSSPRSERSGHQITPILGSESAAQRVEPTTFLPARR